ncbi:Similar to HEXB: Beta-hexosaminidase subunit beta (Felis catus) [Cotesia congregata]|uniref:Beta-hexosaminidase n=1 Tax=Cotesia congregata TaxID=51543 RepID=A0A8J2HHX1_COTCN|nr:Similar to HEXB: Beta-hexosaminidase subunit beta (Felis catus) [Cotesia congregata]
MLIKYFLLFFMFSDYTFGSDFNADAGPWVVPTKGEPWPLVYNQISRHGFLLLQPSVFAIETNIDCDVINDAMERYHDIILREARIGRKAMEDQKVMFDRNDNDFKGMLMKLRINVVGSCEKMPYLHMNEKYELEINDAIAHLHSNSIWGALRGLETFSQLLIPSGDGLNLAIKNQSIIDEPKLPHRGLLLDTSRHFFPVEDIFLTLDAMSYNKLNVFHWHIIDDNSFPYQSSAYPELSQRGAWHPSMVYTPKDVKAVIEHARLRGIRVMPEFDSPGHVASWGLSHPELLTKCYDSMGKPDGRLGPINPTNPGIWPFLRTLLTEVMTVFEDHYIHLGGDEVPFDCWESNPQVISYMEEHGMSKDFTRLESAYIAELLKIPASRNVSSIVWQEVFENRVELTQDTVVHVWTGNWSEKLSKITEAGYPVLLSACWYLDHIAGGSDWSKFYNCDPLDFVDSDKVKDLMLGGEVCMWSEFVDRNNMHQRVWPRASAAAERLWSKSIDSTLHVAQRLEEHTCRMNRRSIPSQPANGPSFCIV